VFEAISYFASVLPRIQMSPWKLRIMIVVNKTVVLLSHAKPYLQGVQALITQI
jgi:hypothetical protein